MRARSANDPSFLLFFTADRLWTSRARAFLVVFAVFQVFAWREPPFSCRIPFSGSLHTVISFPFERAGLKYNGLVLEGRCFAFVLVTQCAVLRFCGVLAPFHVFDGLGYYPISSPRRPESSIQMY